MSSLLILGRQPALGLAELESLYGSNKLRPLPPNAVLVDIDPIEINFSRLGGMVKFAKVLTHLPTTNWREIQKFLEKAVPAHAADLPEGKLKLGLSTYGLTVSPKQLMATGLELKKLIRASGRPVRLIPNTETALSSAQVLHNDLTRKLGWELLFVRDGSQTILAQSVAVQDIERYAARDQKRPMRDAQVGMLPPKLAQIIINLAVDSQSTEPQTILDPFCGTGVVLQEAALMGYGVYGTDLEPRMVEYSEKNLAWLKQAFNIDFEARLSVADATSATWEPPYSAIAAETYLGRPLSSQPDPATLQKIMSDGDTIHTKFLRNVARQTKPGFRLSLAMPAWKFGQGFKHLKLLDSLEKLGYTRIRFEHARDEDLVYHRPDQQVARELVVLERK
jgi:SAM-dependent methyltransferase